MLDNLKSLEAERNTLGTFVIDSDSRKYFSEINTDYFTNEFHKAIFQSINKLHNKGQDIDYITINEELKKIGYKDNLMYLIDLTNNAISSISKTHIKILKDRFKRRKTFELLQKSMQDILNLETEITGINSTIAARIDGINFEDEVISDSLKSVVGRVREDLKKAADPEKIDQYKYGIPELDTLTAGLHPEETTTIAADTGIGKTALALQIGQRLALHGLKVLFISREMSDIQVIKRILTSITGINGNKFRTRIFNKKEWKQIDNILTAIAADMPFYINTSCSTVTEIKNRLRQLKADVLIVDYLQLITPEQSERNREREVAKISRELKNISLDFKIPVIQLSQVGPDGGTRESKAIEQDSNNVIKLVKPTATELEKIINDDSNDITWPLIENARKNDTEIIQVILEKQRDGRTGKFYQFYIKNRLTFKSIPKM